MALTLNEMKVGMNDKVSEQVVDTFVRESEILQVPPKAALLHPLIYRLVRIRFQNLNGLQFPKYLLKKL